jgi:hypothetical protein
MPDISGFQALDVAIGLAFVYFVFSMLASGVNEAIASVFALRARYLERGMRSMLEHPGEGGKLLGQVVNHPLVRSLVRDANTVADTGKLKKRWKPWRRPLPSYLPSRTFSLALLDTLAPPDGARDRRDALQRLRAALAEPKSDAVKLLPDDARKTLESLVVDAGRDHDQLRASIENWFDDTMDRVSGWYKRRTTIILFLIGVVVAGTFNVDSWQLANTFWNNESVRSAVVSQAEKQAKQPLGKAAKGVSDVEQLKLPIGWKAQESQTTKQADRDPRAFPRTPGQYVGKILGLLISAIAISLGAPFWFDLLNRLARLRATGPPEGGPRDRRPRSPRLSTEPV